MEEKDLQSDIAKNHTIKKIDFSYLLTYDEIKTKLHSEILIALEKEGIAYVKKLKTKFYIFLAISIWATFYLPWIIFLSLYVLSFSYLYRNKTWEKLTPKQVDYVTKSLIDAEYKKQLNHYKKEIGIINYIPEGLKYEALGLLTSAKSNYYDAESSLINQAFNLKADGIINLTVNSSSSTRVTGRTGEKGYISSRVDTMVYLQGMAVKLL